ncbi:peroxidase 64 [Tanacetum coccineum]
MGTTPFSVVYGREPPSLLPYVIGETKNAELEQQLVNRDDMLKLLRFNLTKVHDHMRNQANSKHREVTFQARDYAFLKFNLIGRKVWLSVVMKSYPLDSLALTVLNVPLVMWSMSLNYQMMLKFIGSSTSPCSNRSMAPSLQIQIAPLPITKDWEIDVQPASIVDHRWVLEVGQHVLELLVSWTQRPMEEATWETYDLLPEQFSHFCLEDKAFYQRGSNDTNLKVYKRKKDQVKADDQF